MIPLVLVGSVMGGVASVVSLLAHENGDIAASAVALLFDLTDADDAVGDEALKGHQAFVKALVECEGLETLAQSLERFDETVPEEAQARHHALGVFEHIIDDEDVAKRSARVLQTWLSTRIVAKKGDDAVKLYSAEVLSILCGTCASTLSTPETIDSLLRACAKYRRKDPEGPDDEELLENLFQSLAALLSGASSTAVPEFVKAEGVELMLRCLSEGRAAAAPSLRVLATALEHPRDDAMEEATGAPRRVISADGMRHLFPALMGRGAARGAVVGAADRRAKKRRKRRRNDDQRALDEHVVACVAALCLYAANDGAPDEARARLVRKFLEKDQEKLKKVLERYGGYMRDVVAIEREGGADPLQTLARALGAGLHALRLCGAILAFCAADCASTAYRVEPLRSCFSAAKTAVLDGECTAKSFCSGSALSVCGAVSLCTSCDAPVLSDTRSSDMAALEVYDGAVMPNSSYVSPAAVAVAEASAHAKKRMRPIPMSNVPQPRA